MMQQVRHQLAHDEMLQYGLIGLPRTADYDNERHSC
jgi:hypothetical protein